jgi:oligopeptide/dipeptide ABC transporter ATP-binding protein
MCDSLLKINNLTKTYHNPSFFERFYKSVSPVLNKISFNIYSGETLALVGESGCGKSTLAGCILGLIPCDSGTVYHEGANLLTLPSKLVRNYRSQFQMIFQNATQSLNPRQKIYDCIDEVISVNHRLKKFERQIEINKLIDFVKLPSSILNRFPNQLSGGQRQRVVIARALACKPKLLVADEPTSNLDASLKWQIINLLGQLKEELGLTLLLISHDLPLVGKIADRIAVMYQGSIVEIGPATEIIDNALHPYTKLLLQASVLKTSGHISDFSCVEQFFISKSKSKKHCNYINKCSLVSDFCLKSVPSLSQIQEDRKVACFIVSWNEGQKAAYE